MNVASTMFIFIFETNGKIGWCCGTTYAVPAKVEETHTTTSYSLPDAGRLG